VLFVAFAAHMRCHPFLRRPELVEKAARKAARAAEEARVASVGGGRKPPATKKFLKGKGEGGDADTFSEENPMRSGVRPVLKRESSIRRLSNAVVTAGARSAEFIFDYNTVEMTLLFSSILVLLTGIMFKSGRYASDDDDFEYAMLTTMTIGIIAASTLLFAAVVLFEARNSFVHFQEQSSQQTKKKKTKKKKTKKMKKKKKTKTTTRVRSLCAASPILWETHI